MNACQETHFPTWITPAVTAQPAKTTMAEPDEDSVLMVALAKGDETALRALIHKWKRPLVAYFYRSCHSFSDAEDLAQLTFISLYKTARTYEPRGKFSTFIFQIAHRKLLNLYRSKKRKPADATAPEDLPETTSHGENPRNLIEWEELFEQAIATLPDSQRAAILLLKQQELSYDEIAKIMNVSTSAVKTWIHRARAHLRVCIANN